MGSGNILEERGEGGVAHEATLVDGRQDSDLVMEGLAKTSPVIQVQW